MSHFTGEEFTTPGALWRRIRTAGYSLLYILGVHYAYVSYIHPTFEYAHYIYLDHSSTSLFTTYFLAWLPIAAHRPSTDPAQAVAALIYTLSYVPIQLSLLFSVDIKYDHLVWIQVMLAGSMVVLFTVAKAQRKRSPQLVSNQFRQLDYIIGALALMATALLLVANAEHMRLVSFGDVYDLRFESAAVPQSTASAYLISWLSYCFISYLYARGLIYRKWVYIAAGLAMSLTLYMSTGAKTAILLLPVSMGLNWLWDNGRNFLPRLLGAMVVSILVLVLVLPDSGVWMWMKSIFLVRVLGTAGWTASKYLEHFGAEGLTYYSHIGPINALTHSYPFGDLSLGQMIGLAYSGSTEANFNASFWASDGFAALGPIGVLVVTPFVAGVLYLINRITLNLNPRFTVVWMGGFFMALLNVPLSTALLSGGGLVIFLLAWWLSRRHIGARRRSVRRHDTPHTTMSSP